MTISKSHRVAGIAVDHKKQEKDHFYPTPPEATEALLRVEKFTGAIWESACGDGAISKVLKDNLHEVISSDLVDRGYGEARTDFLMEYKTRAPNIITNPPFKLADEFIAKALELYTGKVALLLRIACLAGQTRGLIYKKTPPARVWVFSSRIQMWRNGEVPEGASGGTLDFGWFIWYKGYKGHTKLGWINSATGVTGKSVCGQSTPEQGELS